MFVIAQNSMDRGEGAHAPKTRRRTLEKLFSFLALVAVLFNFLAPVTHGFMSSAHAGEFVEICTKNGIELRPVLFIQSENYSEPQHEDCITCPLCQIGKGQVLDIPKGQAIDLRYGFLPKSGLRLADAVFARRLYEYDLAARAPPIT